jgi:LDH2 family malate/lactate/ureidoglycolate dehydrogenase
MITRSAEQLHVIVKKVLLAAGADEWNAEGVAEHLVASNLSGVDSHGTWHLLGYVKGVQSGDIVPDAHPEILQETASSALVSGNWGFGQPAGREAMQICMDKAKTQNIAIVGVVQKHHLGRLGHYVDMAAAEGLISFVFAGGQSELAPTAMPFGGSRPVLNTNPLAAGFPTATAGHPVMFDFATSCTSGVKVVNANARGEKLPQGYVVDKHGVPTDDPEEFFDDGGHAPFGGHKGYAIMMMVEYIGRIFLGTNALKDDKRGGDILRCEGGTMIALKADLFQEMDAFLSWSDEMSQRVHAVPPAPGFDGVLMPGDPEANARETRRHDGIPIEDDVWATIVEACEMFGITDL